MREELLKDVVVYVAGPNSINIVNLLYGKENVNEFLIAKKLDVTINQARNILYKLAEKGLVRFIRKKDKRNGGWYTYFWTLDVKKSLSSLKKRIEHEIKHLEGQLSSKQTKQFYYCVNCGLEISEENALLYNFTCPECGEVFEAKDNIGYIKEIENKIVDLRNKLEVVNLEIVAIEKKEEASKERKRKVEERKKKAERDLRRKARERERKKAKKGVKKKGKKVKRSAKKKKPARKRKVKKVKKRAPKKAKKVKRKVVKKVKKRRPAKKVRKVVKRSRKKLTKRRR